ncbi:MAG: site-2 protease family protein, partial [Simkaniaceae bacterium]|nr:site-2 protease family protein [Simkaniaceae bacterium]
MLATILYTVLALLGLSFLVFIHELGHYIVARRNGMRVEIFSIGMGKPFYSWERKGVKWQLCYLVFGGYVKIAGQDKGEDGKEPHEIPDGFASKTPWQRIKVVAAGPIVNIVCALALFTVIWMVGGRQKPFSQYTKLIGSVDANSELYDKGVRSGDLITRLNDHPYGGIQDLAYASVMKNETVEIDGEMIDYYTGKRMPFDVKVTPYEEMHAAMPGTRALGITAPASFMIYKTGSDFAYNPASAGMPMQGTGIKEGDRLLWADGELLFSQRDLTRVVNESVALVTVQRGNTRFMTKVPRMKISDIRITPTEKAEVDDWHYAAMIKGNTSDLFFVPYSIGNDLVVSKPFTFINEQAHQSTVRQRREISPLSVTLRSGDRIVAVDGMAVANGQEFLKVLQKRHVQIIDQR